MAVTMLQGNIKQDDTVGVAPFVRALVDLTNALHHDGASSNQA
jgi:hypothetical protein